MASVSTGEFNTAPQPGAAPPGAPPGAPPAAAPPVAAPPGPPAAPNAPAAQSATREGWAPLEEIQEARDRFDHYWMGLYDWWRQMNAEGRRRAWWTRIRVPKSRPPGPRRNPPDAPALRLDARRTRWRQPTRADPNNLQQYVAQAQNGKYQLMTYMRPLGFRLLKILGKGGFGMACLFEMTDVDGGKHKIVVKAGTGRDLNRERVYLRVSL